MKHSRDMSTKMPFYSWNWYIFGNLMKELSVSMFTFQRRTVSPARMMQSLVSVVTY